MVYFFLIFLPEFGMTILFGEGLRRITYPGFYGNKLPNLYYLDISGGLNAFYTAVFRQLHRDKKLSFKTGLMFFFLDFSFHSLN